MSGATRELVTYRIQDGVAVIAVDNPPVNALSVGVPEGLEAALDRAAGDEGVRAIVVMGAGIDGTVHATTFTLTVLARSGTGLTGFFSGLRRTATYTGIRY